MKTKLEHINKFASWTAVKGLSEMEAKRSLMEMSDIAGSLAYWLHIAEIKHNLTDGENALQSFAEAISKLEGTK
tara:strand:+ start:154 stop:375 length:222 start_codon:yes stop_codon:yes gene_type:complete